MRGGGLVARSLIADSSTGKRNVTIGICRVSAPEHSALRRSATGILKQQHLPPQGGAPAAGMTSRILVALDRPIRNYLVRLLPGSPYPPPELLGFS